MEPSGSISAASARMRQSGKPRRRLNLSSAARRARSGLRAAHLDRRDGERQPKDPLGKADAVHGSVLPLNNLSNIHAASRFPLSRLPLAAPQMVASHPFPSIG